MLGLDYDTAKTLAIALVVGFLVLSVISAIIVKNITTKIISALLMVGLALGVWTQRDSLQDCAERARARVGTDATTALTCTFFGSDVTILDEGPSE